MHTAHRANPSASPVTRSVMRPHCQVERGLHTRHESDLPGAWRLLECGGLTPLWIEESAGFGGKRKSAVKPAHSKNFRSGRTGSWPVAPELGRPGYSPTTPAPRGFGDSRVTQSVMRPCCQVGRGLCLWAICAALRLDPPRTSSGAPRIRTRRTGLSRPTFSAYRPQLLPNHTRRARGRGEESRSVARQVRGGATRRPAPGVNRVFSGPVFFPCQIHPTNTNLRGHASVCGS